MTLHALDVPGLGKVDLTVAESGHGSSTYLLLHGGGGPFTVAGFAPVLGAHGRVFTPTHPGFNGTPRPGTLTSVGGIARVYAAFLAAAGAREVIVVGNSFGGWVAAELALLAPARLGRVILVNAVGIEVEGHPVADVSRLTPAQLTELAWHDPSKFQLPAPTEAGRAMGAANMAAMKMYGGANGSSDPTLRARLADAKVPATVLWGESDRIVDATYGRAFAEAFPRGTFELLPETGHVPQLETPELLLAAILRAVEPALSAARSPAPASATSPAAPAPSE